jgi:hypothetical protein
MKKPLFARLLFLLLIVISIPFTSFGQREVGEDSKFTDRLYVGGNFGLQFGTITFVDLSPVIGYMINNRLSVGPGVTYQYLQTNIFSTNTYGGRGFVRYNFSERLFGHGEYERLNLTYYNPLENRLKREWVPGLFVGGGVFQPFGRRGGVALTLLYNLAHDQMRSPYIRPLIIRAGFTL